LEGGRIFKKILTFNFAHLPTLLLIIGYPVFWLEMYGFNSTYGRSTMLAVVVFAGISIFLVACQYRQIREGMKNFYTSFTQLSPSWKIFLAFTGMITGVILLCGMYVASFPPHLVQESDALNYHITMPRQHLILGSFSHLPWATADLYFLPLNFALAPYWLVTVLPNKMPQFLFFIGLIAMGIRLTKIFSKDYLLSSLFILFAIVGSHNVSIQMGTAMLDVIMCYLLLAAIDSFLEGNIGLSAIEFTFFFWSKSFVPLQMGLIILVFGVLYIIGKKLGFKEISWTGKMALNDQQKGKYKHLLKKGALYFFMISLFVGGPFIGKSLYYAQTPLFPFFLGSVSIGNPIDKESTWWKSLVENSEIAMATRDQYGSGRSPLELLKHFWLIAVPEKGVNNRYDYPVGLMYLLCLGPFFYVLMRSIFKKQFAILPLFIGIYWVLWWAGTHQSRFLFIPIILMYIVVLSRPQFVTRIFMMCITLALGLTCLSVLRAHRSDFGKSAYEVLRSKDQQLLRMSKVVKRDQPVEIDFADVAFADFSVDVRGVDSVFVIKR